MGFKQPGYFYRVSAVASNTYTACGIVLKKTKLGESDLILSFILEDGSQLRAVAKGARKPSSSFSSRLELYSVVDLLVCEGKNLDIITEARLLAYNEAIRQDIVYAAAAAPIAEFLDRATQVDLPVPQLFELTRVALDCLGNIEAQYAPSITAAHLLKTFAFLGLRPNLSTCVYCGSEVDLALCGETVNMSLAEGGVVCSACGSFGGALPVATQTCRWVQALLLSTFADIVTFQVMPDVSFEILRLCQRWIGEHVGHSLKSFNFLFTSNLFE